MPRLRNKIFSIGFLIPVIAAFIITSCNPADRKRTLQKDDGHGKELIIFHAGSLAAPFKKISQQFEAENPGVIVKLEAAGSVDCARKITELHKVCDLMASSDYNVIEKFLIPDYTGWHLPFAANEMVIAYTENSKNSDRVSDTDWPVLLLEPDIRFARSDPDSDPCGYRTLMVFQLAEMYYGKPGISENLVKKDIRYIRPKEVDLIALLEVGEVDYIFTYRSVAIQHHLKFIELPDEVNLKNPEFSELYRSSSVMITANRPGDSVLIHGEPMLYSITLLNGAPNPILAEEFLEFLLEPSKGMAIMQEMGQQSVIPSQSQYYSHIPDKFREYVYE